MNARSKRARLRSSTSQVAAVASARATTCAGATRRASRWSTLTAALPLLLSLALLAFFVLDPRGASPVRATSASMAATNAAARSRVVPAVAASSSAGVDVTKRGDADATYDPAAPRREPEADDVVRVLGKAGLPARLGNVEPGERVAFQGRVYETRAGPGDELEVRDSGLRLSRVTRTYRRHSPTLVELTVRYGDGREGVLTGTPEHPFYVPAHDGYVPMGELGPGVALQTTDGAAATVVARSERHGDVEVYNLEVEHTHNYFVSPPGSDGPGVLVHNATYGPGGGKGPPNPYGKRGGPAHQAKVEELVQTIEARGLKAELEHRVLTPGGVKGTRYVDVVAKDAQGNVVEMHQVGRQTKGGAPVAREVDALDDIQGATGFRPNYHPYNND